MNAQTARNLGARAYHAGDPKAPIFNPDIHAWLEETAPEVGDPRTKEIFSAFGEGYEDARSEEMIFRAALPLPR